jgi:hypothetical protein
MFAVLISNGPLRVQQKLRVSAPKTAIETAGALIRAGFFYENVNMYLKVKGLIDKLGIEHQLLCLVTCHAFGIKL